MASLMQTINSSAADVVGSVGAMGRVISKNMGALDRVSDASYSHADTFVENTLIRNQGSLKDTILDEEENDLEREIRRMKFTLARNAFMDQHPELKPKANIGRPKKKVAAKK